MKHEHDYTFNKQIEAYNEYRHTSSTRIPSSPSCKVVGTSFTQGEDWALCKFTPKTLIVGLQYFLLHKLVDKICKEKGSNATIFYEATI